MNAKLFALNSKRNFINKACNCLASLRKSRIPARHPKNYFSFPTNVKSTNQVTEKLIICHCNAKYFLSMSVYLCYSFQLFVTISFVARFKRAFSFRLFYYTGCHQLCICMRYVLMVQSKSDFLKYKKSNKNFKTVFKERFSDHKKVKSLIAWKWKFQSLQINEFLKNHVWREKVDWKLSNLANK